MTIFDKPLSEIVFADIKGLLEEKARENIRLEFKREFPSKEELLKKITGFANTYGGFIVIGIEEDGKGTISALKGVPEVPGIRQKVIQYCFGGCSPPVNIEISNSIKDEKTENVYYVIYVPASSRTPHFINGRKGCYIRTDEFSQRFETHLANLNEIAYMQNQREASIEFRKQLITKAIHRFNKHVEISYKQHDQALGEIDTTMFIGVSPAFPQKEYCDPELIRSFLAGQKINARSDQFPIGNPQAQQDGFYLPDPRGLSFSYLEIDVFAKVFFALEVARIENLKNEDISPEDVKIFANEMLGWIIFYIQYSESFFQKIGYVGPVSIFIKLERVLRRTFFIFFGRFLSDSRYTHGAPFDDEVEFSIEVQTGKMSTQELYGEIFKKLGQACGWVHAYSASDEDIDYYINLAFQYLNWQKEN